MTIEEKFGEMMEDLQELANDRGFTLAAVIVEQDDPRDEKKFSVITSWAPHWKVEFEKGCKNCQGQALRMVHDLMETILESDANTVQ